MKIATFDIDGVIFMGGGYPGIRPGPNDIIVTGRSFEEEEETVQMLIDRQIIFADLIMNPIPFNEKTRQTSGIHKGHTIRGLLDKGKEVVFHYEDDPIQADIIEQMVPEIRAIRVNHNNFIELENIRQGDR